MDNRLVAMFLLASSGSVTLRAAQDAAFQADIYLNVRDGSSQVLGPGKRLVSNIFEQARVRLCWHAGGPATDLGDEGLPAFEIRTVERALRSATPEALASTQILGRPLPEIVIYRDRLEQLIAGHARLAKVAAAYVVAHELAHAMQGVARHSRSGILRARWSAPDLQDMVFRQLAFTASDIALIHRGLAAQLAARPAKAPVADWGEESYRAAK